MLGPHPYPTMVRDFQSVIGRERASKSSPQTGRLPDAVVACIVDERIEQADGVAAAVVLSIMALVLSLIFAQDSSSSGAQRCAS